MIPRFVLAIALLGLAPAAALADDTCEIRIAPVYLWAPINTTSASDSEGGPTVDVTQGETGLNGAWGAKVEMRKDGTTLSVGGWYASLGYDANAGRPRALDFKVALFELYGGHRVVDSLSVFGGVRFYDIDLEYSSSTVSSIDQETRLLDPVVGVWYNPRLSKSWTVAVAGDVGGFTVGFDVSASVSGVFSWKPTKHFGLDVGYRAFYMKKDGDSGVLETTFYGPIIGAEIYF